MVYQCPGFTVGGESVFRVHLWWYISVYIIFVVVYQCNGSTVGGVSIFIVYLWWCITVHIAL